MPLNNYISMNSGNSTIATFSMPSFYSNNGYSDNVIISLITNENNGSYGNSNYYFIVNTNKEVDLHFVQSL